jgi:hypothetical protein
LGVDGEAFRLEQAPHRFVFLRCSAATGRLHELVTHIRSFVR